MLYMFVVMAFLYGQAIADTVNIRAVVWDKTHASDKVPRDRIATQSNSGKLSLEVHLLNTVSDDRMASGKTRGYRYNDETRDNPEPSVCSEKNR